jgi:hypothetical protein
MLPSASIMVIDGVADIGLQGSQNFGNNGAKWFSTHKRCWYFELVDRSAQRQNGLLDD